MEIEAAIEATLEGVKALRGAGFDVQLVLDGDTYIITIDGIALSLFEKLIAKLGFGKTKFLDFCEHVKNIKPARPVPKEDNSGAMGDKATQELADGDRGRPRDRLEVTQLEENLLDGGCNFCADKGPVFQIKGIHPMRFLVVRMCRKCLAELAHKAGEHNET